MWEIADKYICWNINNVIGKTLIKNQINKVSSYLLNPADKILISVSSKVFKPKQVWNDKFVFSGYLRWQEKEDELLESKIIDFSNGSRLPILTFGSVNFENSQKIMERFIRNWPNDKKIIIQSGWANLSITGYENTVLNIGKISHDQLFKHASVVIHHGGAGTTASVLHSGVPHIIVPHFGDQFFFAKQVINLGVGLRLKRDNWPESLLESIESIEGNKEMQNTSFNIAETLRNEDGPMNAVLELERLSN